MSVYEAVRVYKERRSDFLTKFNLSVFLQHLCCFGLSFLFSFAGFSKSFSPFAVSFTACVYKRFTITSTVGAVVGYFVALDSVNALRYTATVLALTVILISLKNFKGVRTQILTPVIASFICLATTGIAMSLSQKNALISFAVAICEAFLGAAATYVFSKAKAYLMMKNGVHSLTSKEVTSLVITASLLLLSLRFVNIYGVSLSGVFAVLLILICSCYGKEAGGSIVGICCGVTSGFSSGNLVVAVFYAFGGLLSGVLSSFGKVCCFVAFVLSGAMCIIVSQQWEMILSLSIETAIASLLFFIFSHKYNYSLKEFFCPTVTSPAVESVKSNITERLHKISEFSAEICSTLDNVNDALLKSEKSNVNFVSQKVKNSVCSSCGLYNNCWVECKNETKKCFDELFALKKQGEYLQYKNIPVSFTSFCIRNDAISSSFNKYFTEYKINEKAENRIKEIQTLASQQFVNVASLLDSLCNDINEEVTFDIDAATRCKAIAMNMNLKLIDCCCILDSSEKLRVELRLTKQEESKNFNELKKQLSVVLNKNLEYPVVEEFGDYVKLIFKEKPCYRVVSSAVQFNATGEKYSGDTYSTFYDEKGVFYSVICDGMGTGAKAAVSSSLAVTLLEKLIKAGFSIESSVKTVNTSLISKSGEECSVTLDLVSVDLYNGRVEFYKCGAQHTLVKRRSKISQINFETLPLGIINNVEIGFGSGTVGYADVIVMCSDGVREEDFWQLRNAVKVFDSGNVRSFTEEISEIIRRSQPEKRDDYTMITLAVTEN